MTFLEQIVSRLERAAAQPVLAEVRDGREIVSVTGRELLAMVAQARAFVRTRALNPGDRCALYAPNSIRWVALDLALMSEGVIAVPLDPRQVAGEVAGVLRDCTPALACCADAAFASNVAAAGNSAPPIVLFDDVFAPENESSEAPPSMHHADHDAVTIVYTSGTSGEPKGVVLTARNITFMLGCTNARLDQLMGARQEPERIFQYAPFCFAAARILLLTSLSRNSMLTLSTDLAKLSDELKLAAPHYFVNVPIFLERVRRKVEESIRGRGGFAAGVYSRAMRAYLKRQRGESDFSGSLALWLANSMMFPAIRASIGPNLKALICGSAPLALETQLFFMMLGIPVLQVYGLTETTAICTMDVPGHPVPGRVGPAVPGIEMMVGENDQILVRGPNVFPGYWQRPQETAKALAGGWFHTGDQGEVDASGNWRITGRLKNLIVLNSGHNVAPEPIEHELAARIPDAQQVVLVGNQRSFLSALVVAGDANATVNGSNGLSPAHIQAALDAINSGLPHYKQIRAFHMVHEPFTVENGLLTTMGKLKRDAIAAYFAVEIEQLYRKKSA
ncbi:MAG TPA: AMP-binding protein [Candidatus Dormibacteraeota bacterium]|nr:AMP-binding protein [Candidatus Dormibacteraeota bacterium]